MGDSNIEPQQQQPQQQSGAQQGIAGLEANKAALLRRLDDLKWEPLFTYGGLLVAAGGLVLRVWALNFPEALSYMIMAYGVVFFGMGLSRRSSARRLENDLQALEFQIDLVTDGVDKHEIRAERSLHFNNTQLRRYHDQNLRQNRGVFVLGVVCIFLGVGVVFASFYFIKNAPEIETQIVTGALGAVGSLLTSYVAVIYLRMNTAATEMITAFHRRLMSSQAMFMGNLLASRISNEEKRWAVLADLARELVQREEEEKSATTPASPGMPTK